MTETDDKPTAYDRDRLRDEVWAEPVGTVALRYGVSDVALAKTCRKLHVPLPGVGYWARLRSGQKMKRAPLPAKPEGVPQSLPVVHFTPQTEQEPSADTRARMTKEADPEAVIVVKETLERPHPLVRDTRKVFTMRDPPTLPCLDVSVSRASLDRALRILDALLKAIESRGMSVEVKKKSPTDRYRPYIQERLDPTGTRVKANGEWVALGLEERSRVVIPDPPEPPKHLRGGERERWIEYHRPVRSLEYNGVLVLRFRNADYLNVRKEWKDGARKKLEDQLNDVIAHLYLAAEALKQKRIEHEEAERAKIERQRLEHEEYLLRQEEERKLKQLSQLLESWRLARGIRDFVQEALSLNADPAGLLDWGLHYADKIDPLSDLRIAGSNEEGTK